MIKHPFLEGESEKNRSGSKRGKVEPRKTTPSGGGEFNKGSESLVALYKKGSVKRYNKKMKKKRNTL